MRVICSSSDNLLGREDEGMADADGAIFFRFCSSEQRVLICRAYSSYRGIALARNVFEGLSRPFSAKDITGR